MKKVVPSKRGRECYMGNNNYDGGRRGVERGAFGGRSN